ncbi:MAG: chemotaxis protein CheX [Planctomycetaceae bacterium]|nr:chemotaxis protein CheX [Planctomycetaceae bacterium]
MTTATPALSPAALTAEYVNPLITATRDVFEMMLGCTPVRSGLRLKQPGDASPEVSAVIGISGGAAGTIVVGMSGEAACEVLKRMIGAEAYAVNDQVCDAVGEITNMIAGSAKAQLAKYQLSISLPNVVTGDGLRLHFPSNVCPMVVEFQSDIGPLSIEVGFTEI